MVIVLILEERFGVLSETAENLDDMSFWQRLIISSARTNTSTITTDASHKGFALTVRLNYTSTVTTGDPG
jgi:hypothetical protein